MALRAELSTEREKNEAELRNRTMVEEELRGEISWLKTDREAFQNKTRVFEQGNTLSRNVFSNSGSTHKPIVASYYGSEQMEEIDS